MRMFTKRMMSVILSLTILVSISSPAFAIVNGESANQDVGTADEIQYAKEAYYALSPEAQAIFESSLANDPALAEFHRTYVDPSFTVSIQECSIAAVTTTVDPLAILNTQLAAIGGLPTAVLYNLKALGSGIVAAMADGPLLLGDIILAAATVSTAIVLAREWNSIYPKWNQVVTAFQKAFSQYATNIINAFSSIRNDINDELASNPCVTVSGRTITVNGTAYECKEKAESVTLLMKNLKDVYYPAYLSGGYVWVYPVNIDINIAKAIMKLNSSKYGVFAINDFAAKGLCAKLGGAIGPESHGSGEGYWYHYHGASCDDAHCWFAFM